MLLTQLDAVSSLLKRVFFSSKSQMLYFTQFYMCSIRQPKWHEQILKQAKWRDNCRFWDVFGSNRDLVIILDKVDFWKTLQPCKPLVRSCMFGKGYLSGLSPNLDGDNCHKVARIHLFWEPCAKGMPKVILNGKQCRQVPNVWILLLRFQVFPDPGDGIFQKLGDDCPCECDAPPHGLGWASHHPCTKWKRIFEANASRCQGQSQGFSVSLEWKQMA